MGAPRSQGNWARVAAFSASLTGFFSIAVSHILLGATLLLALVSRVRWRVPPAAVPIAAFLGWTLVSAAASEEPAAAWPQLKKFYVFLFLPLLYTLLPGVREARRLLEAWFVAGGVLATLGIAQFLQKWYEASAAGEDFLLSYAPDRITGFFSHWMTFSQAALLIWVMLLCFLLFCPAAKRGRVLWVALAAVLAVGLALSYTRSVWLAMIVVGLYLTSVWKPRLLWLVPVAAALLYWSSPESMRRRVDSIGDLSQNQARLIMWRTGASMIEARPVFGVGPQRVGPLFEQYMPEEIPGMEALPPAYYGHLHNIYIHFAAERGLPALLALLWWLGRVLWDAGRGLQSVSAGRSEERFLLHGLAACTLAVLVVGCFDLTLGDSEVLAAYLAVLALGYQGLSREPQAESAASPHAPR